MLEIGPNGLERLQKSRAVVVGVGGVGSGVALCLAKSGVGYLRLVDQDIVEPSNLHRLHGASEQDLYRPKAELAAEVLSRANPWASVEAVVDTVRSENVEDALDGIDVVIDCVDNFRTRLVLNRKSRDMGKPYLFTSAIASQGHLAIFQPPITACLECAMPGVTERPEESCESLGITPATVDLVGSIAASETLKLLLALPTLLRGVLLTIDLAGPQFIFSHVPKRESCSVCGETKVEPDTRDTVFTMLCGSDTANAMPRQNLNLNLEAVSERILSSEILRQSDSVLVYRFEGFTVSLFRSGRLLINGVHSIEQAEQVAARVWEQTVKEMMVSPAGN